VIYLANFIGGLFFGIIIGLAICLIFHREEIFKIKKIDDEKTRELMKILDLAEGDSNGI
jgi:hypothetical protein